MATKMKWYNNLAISEGIILHEQLTRPRLIQALEPPSIQLTSKRFVFPANQVFRKCSGNKSFFVKAEDTIRRYNEMISHTIGDNIK